MIYSTNVYFGGLVNYSIEADTKAEAIEKANKRFLNEDCGTLDEYTYCNDIEVISCEE